MFPAEGLLTSPHDVVVLLLATAGSDAASITVDFGGGNAVDEDEVDDKDAALRSFS